MSARADEHSTEPVGQSPLPRPITSRSAISAALVEQARDKFERRSSQQYTEHEVREMLGTLSDFVSLLIEWDQNPVPQGSMACRIDGINGTGA